MEKIKWIKHKHKFRYYKRNGSYIVCAWCGFRDIKATKKKIENNRKAFEKKIEGGVSHGLCPECEKIERKIFD